MDWIIFPDEAVFRKVEESKGRVYLLEWKASDKKVFFWMQEQSADKDSEYCLKMNQYFNNPPEPGQSDMGGSSLGGLGNLDSDVLLQMLEGNRGSSGGASNVSSQPVANREEATRAPVNNNNNPVPVANPPKVENRLPKGPGGSLLQKSDLEQFLRNITMVKGPSLGKVLNTEAIIQSGILNDEDAQKTLLQYLPKEEQDDPENLISTLRSPQFRQTIGVFNAALNDGQISLFLSSLGLDPSSLSPNAGVLDLLKALAKKNAPKKDDMDTSK
eukprot:TRINITY_DN2687_c0_g1_i1.p1 TRINITY_DN2687_c0_g1~~TRINITY_DN2687_c0_g1_i1.p1  ORF type:complete len:272 (+),score=63.84 TRINITY_DN2687_c0_g1_i1:228-1043(+)